MASANPAVSRQGTAGKRKSVTLTTLQEPVSSSNRTEVMASCNNGLSAVYDVKNVRANYSGLWIQ
jgi:hypothetical protein